MKDCFVLYWFYFAIKKLVYYYSGSEYSSVLYKLIKLLRRSCALTLAHRHRIRTSKFAFMKWGKNLRIEYKFVNRNKIFISKLVEFSLSKVKTGK